HQCGRRGGLGRFDGSHMDEGPLANPPADTDPRRFLVRLGELGADRPETVEYPGRHVLVVGHPSLLAAPARSPAILPAPTRTTPSRSPTRPTGSTSPLRPRRAGSRRWRPSWPR